jgi:uncharacterized membrane protein
MLVMFPLGLFVTAVIFDFADLVGGPALLGEVAYWNIVAGLIGGLLAGAAGAVDLLFIPSGTRAKRVGTAHALINTAVLLAFALSWLVRRDAASHAIGGWLFTLELFALMASGFGAWLGGELVDRLGVGVDRDADLDARPSLRTGLITARR